MAAKLDQLLVDKRNPDIPFFQKLPDWSEKLYLMTFRKFIVDEVLEVIKIGKTKYVETYDRIIFNHKVFVEGKEDSWVKDSMFGYFDEVVVNASAQLTTLLAVELEKKILKAWGAQDLDIPKINGMSEMRKYTKQRFAIAKNIIEKNRYVRS